MKNYKLLTLLLPIFAANSTFAAESFITKEAQPYLKNCQPYNDSKTIKFFGMEGTQSLSISPQSDGSCKVESITDMDMMTNITSCTFNQEQIGELVTAFADDGSQEHSVQIPIYMERSDGTRSLGGSMTMKGTLEEVTISKFMNNPDICQTNTVDKEKEMKKEFVDALNGCKNYNKKIEMMGFGIEFSVTPSTDGLCGYNLISRIPAVTMSVGENEQTSSENKIEVNCRLNNEQTDELIKFIKNDEPSATYTYTNADGGTAKAQFLLPQAFLDDNDICTVNH